MRRISKTAYLFAIAALALGVACTDQIPTLPDPGQFPGALPSTIQHVVGPSALVLSAEVVSGGTDVADVFFKLVANDFEGALNSHLLAQFDSFPKAVRLPTGVDSTFTYEDSWVTATLPDSLRVSAGALAFDLWTVTQDWDSTAVSWRNAVDRPGATVPWTVPGGTRGTLIGRSVWNQAATGANADSLRWSLPAAIMTQLANGHLPGLMVTMGTGNARAEISSIVIDARTRPASTDTVVSQVLQSLAQTFVYDPEPERPDDVLLVGGITSDRAHLRLKLDNALPGCVDAIEVCTDFRDPTSVSVNRVQLLLDPLPVPNGFRPITPLRLTVRALLEPELGPRATLGPIVAEDTISFQRFTEPDGEPIVFDLTSAVAIALSRGDAELAVAILIEPEASTPSFAWLGRNARLRLVYTLPQRPQLP